MFTLENTPTVSIGMPVYNGEPFIRDALDSLLGQTFIDFELIISDNASTDNTEKICREYASKDERIRYIRQTENRGASANFQFVLNEAVGEYFIWAAADDLQSKEFLEIQVESLKKNNEIVLITTDVQNIDELGHNLNIARLNSIRTEKALAHKIKNRELFFRNPTSNVFFAIYGLYRREKLRQINWEISEMLIYATGSEIPLLAQVSLYGVISSVPVVSKTYRRHSKSVFHREAANFNLLKKFINQVNISAVLFYIVSKSNLPFFEKLYLFSIVLTDALILPLRFLWYSWKKIIKVSMSQK